MGVIVSCGVFRHFRNFKCCLPWYRPLLHCMTPFPGYIIMQHTAAFTPPHLLQPTRQSGWLWTWLDAVKKTSNQAAEAAAWAPRQYWFSAGVSEDVTSVARRRGGHRGVIKEGLVILVSRSPAGGLWGRALISTNRFLMRASQALQPHQFPNPPLVLTRDNPTVVSRRKKYFLIQKNGIGLQIEIGTNNSDSLVFKRGEQQKMDGVEMVLGQCTVLPAEEISPMMRLPPMLKPDSLIMASSPSQLTPLSTSSPDAA